MLLDTRTIGAPDLVLLHEADRQQAATPAETSRLYERSDHPGHAVRGWFDAVVEHVHRERCEHVGNTGGIPPRMEDVQHEIRTRILSGEKFSVARDFHNNDIVECIAVPAPQSTDPFANETFLSEEEVPEFAPKPNDRPSTRVQ
ncbi:MAG: hypothetical protein PHE68_04525 [Candidatus Peribacteraceae bacterium]|nr:hypothetical protein [Candidatus Peribacteraceae bacterium]MDD5074551.1 hypothetical protein [Candidatus Peribacteraceae bacterium]